MAFEWLEMSLNGIEGLEWDLVGQNCRCGSAFEI